MRKVYFILAIVMVACLGCQWQLKPHSDTDDELKVTIARYDRIENLYLTTGDYSALQQMNTYFPTQTRMLIEDVLQLGKVNDPDINTKFLYFFQDSTLQTMLQDVQREFADMEDIEEELTDAFERLRDEMPEVELPEVYAQIGSFDQSIVVGNKSLGVCLDKYLGVDYPFYQTYYDEGQRRMMVRSMIVPDCLSFYILSLYPLPAELLESKPYRDFHMGKIQWLVNQLLSKKVFENPSVEAVSQYMQQHKQLKIEKLLREIHRL